MRHNHWPPCWTMSCTLSGLSPYPSCGDQSVCWDRSSKTIIPTCWAGSPRSSAESRTAGAHATAFPLPGRRQSFCAAICTPPHNRRNYLKQTPHSHRRRTRPLLLLPSSPGSRHPPKGTSGKSSDKQRGHCKKMKINRLARIKKAKFPVIAKHLPRHRRRWRKLWTEKAQACPLMKENASQNNSKPA